MTKYLVSICILFSGCSTLNNSNDYEAYWYETYFKLTLNKNLTFKYIHEGHLGNSEYEGTYKILNDTIVLNESSKKMEELRFLRYDDDCLVELETRFSYCKRTTEEWGSERIAINYPQLKESNPEEKETVIELINIALTNPELEKYFDSKDGQLKIQEYFEIREENNVELNYKGNNAVILSKEEIERNQIEEYLVIDEITIGLNSAMIDFQIMPEFSVGILDFFKKENGDWKLNKRTL